MYFNLIESSILLSILSIYYSIYYNYYTGKGDNIRITLSKE